MNGEKKSVLVKIGFLLFNKLIEIIIYSVTEQKIENL